MNKKGIVPKKTKPEKAKPEKTKPEETKPEETKQKETKQKETKQKETKQKETKKELNKKFKKEYQEDKHKAKIVKNLKRNQLSTKKEKLKQEIKKEHNKEKRVELKKQYNNIIKKGASKNEPNDLINITGLNKYYANRGHHEHILKDVDLNIKKGDVVSIFGASGSGKTTLINIISGLLPFEKGRVIVNNVDLFYLTESKRTKFRADNLSFIFQSYNLIPSLTTEENIRVGYELRDKKQKDIIQINDLLKSLGLTALARKYPFQMSGGQQQRISIGRAIAKNPKIIFADEPTGALDEKTGKDILKLLLEINKKYKTTIIMVTHNPNIAQISDSTIVVKDGKISEIRINKNKIKVDNIKWA